MTEQYVEIVLQRARERFPEAQPGIISGNGPQFIAAEIQQLICLSGVSPARSRQTRRTPAMAQAK